MWIAFQAVRKCHIDSVGQPVLGLFRHGRYWLHQSGTRPSADASSYTASYGDAITTVQTYSATASKLPMTGSSDSGDKTKLNFTVTCGLLKLSLAALGKESDQTISKIEVIGTPTEGVETTYTLTCSAEAGESIGSAKDFYIALPAGSYTDMVFYNKSGYVCQKSAKTAMAIENNKIQPVTLTGIAFNLLPGKFSVSDTKKVKFTKGNLYWDGSAFKIEGNQTDYPANWSTSHVSHLFWTKTAEASYAASYSDGTCATSDVPFFVESKGGLTVDGQSGLYALSNEEWTYLISTRTNDASNLYKYGVKVSNGGTNYANCLIIAPDDFTGTLEASYTLDQVNASGLVCLPAAGLRYGSYLYYAGSGGYYWSATPVENYAYSLCFNGGDVNPSFNSYRNYGFSVRLFSSVSN